MNVIVSFAMLLLVCVAGEAVSYILLFPFPASVIGMVLFFVLLKSGLVKAERVDAVSTFLVDHLALFFIPPVLDILNYLDILSQNLWPILVICVGTTPLVFLAAGKTVQWTMRFFVKAEGEGHD